MLNAYKAKVNGSMDQVRCITREIPACPQPFKVYVMQAKFWGYKNGPLSLPDIASQEFASAAPDAVAAAC